MKLSMNLENIVELERPTFSDIVAWPLASWLLYYFLAQIFLQWVGLEKEYRKGDWGLNIVRFVDKVDTVDKEVENLTRGR